VEARQAEVEAMHAQVWPPQPPDPEQKKRARSAAKQAADLPQSDADLLNLAYPGGTAAKIRALYNGDISGLPRPERGRPGPVLAARLLHRR
jgi:hypothetical protein